MELRLGDVKATDLHTGFAAWVDRLSRSTAETVPARRLYAGDHWSVVRTLEDVAAESDFEAALWVCSAGYGLIGLDTKIKPYSATFAANDPDTICKWRTADLGQEVGKCWWRLHTEWGGPDASISRSVAMVAMMYPESPLLIVASYIYLRAILEDVRRAAQVLSDPDLLCVISAGTEVLPGLEANLLPATAALQQSVGGSLGSLNARLARAVLSGCTAGDLRASYLKSSFMQRVVAAPPNARYRRVAMNDEQVRAYIAAALANDSKTSWSALLRRFRDSGRTCQQERFLALFKAAKGAVVA